MPSCPSVSPGTRTKRHPLLDTLSLLHYCGSCSKQCNNERASVSWASPSHPPTCPTLPLSIPPPMGGTTAHCHLTAYILSGRISSIKVMLMCFILCLVVMTGCLMGDKEPPSYSVDQRQYKDALLWLYYCNKPPEKMKWHNFCPSKDDTIRVVGRQRRKCWAGELVTVSLVNPETHKKRTKCELNLITSWWDLLKVKLTQICKKKKKLVCSNKKFFFTFVWGNWKSSPSLR